MRGEAAVLRRCGMAPVRIKFDKRPVDATKIPFKGVGAQLNTNIFRPTSIFPDPEDAAKDHPKDPDREGQPQALTPAQRKKLGDAITNLRLGHSRVFVTRILTSTLEPPRKELAAFLDTLRLAQNAGANVNLTFWGQGTYANARKLKALPWPEPQVRLWPPEREHHGHHKWPPQLMDEGELTGPAELMRRFAGIVARTQQEGLTCVKYLTIQNEPNQGKTDLAQKGNPILARRVYERLYRLLDESLSELGVRRAVSLVGGDLVREGNSPQKDWFEYIAHSMDRPRRRFPSVVDAYSIHIYWEPGGGKNGFPQKLEDRLKDLRDQRHQFGVVKPVYVTEFGVKASGKPEPGGVGSGQRIEFNADVAFQHAWFMALAPQYGCAGLVKWVAYRTDRRSGWGEWGMIDAPNPPSPRTSFGRSPTYRVIRLFNHLVDQDWRADGFGKSGDGMVLVSRFKGPRHESVAVLNRDSKAREIVVDGLRPQKYFAADWNQDRKGGPAKERPQPLVPHGHAQPLTVPALGIVALSTRPLQLAQE
jgi:hypothetical protein